jgi:hypothetical protein
MLKGISSEVNHDKELFQKRATEHRQAAVYRFH